LRSPLPEWPVNDSEIEILANVMIERHGIAAARTAAGRVNDMIEGGDPEGRDVWARIVRAIHRRQNAPFEPPPRG
jgi:hypothetical protein